MGELRTPAGSQLPVFALDVVDGRGAGPGEQRRHDKPHALARPGRREGHDMLRTVMTQIAAVAAPEHDARVAVKAGARDLAPASPAGRPVGRDEDRKSTRLNSSH